MFCSNGDIICIKINGQKLGLNNDLFVCLCYVIPENSSRQSVLEVHTYDRLIEYIGELSSEYEHDFNFVFCGDLNSRTSVNPDFVLDDNLLEMDVLPPEYCIDVNTNRQSQDRCTNDNGNRLLELCKQTGLRIMNGRVCNDRDIGRYTFVGSRGSSVVDYVIATQNLFKNVTSFNVHEPNILSDHCVVDFTLSFDILENNNCTSIDEGCVYQNVE